MICVIFFISPKRTNREEENVFHVIFFPREIVKNYVVFPFPAREEENVFHVIFTGKKKTSPKGEYISFPSLRSTRHGESSRA